VGQKLKNVEEEKRFAALLLKWNRLQNNRQMPWKGEKDPYKIWLSEIILQQTRVEQGMDYYRRFIQKFPDVHKLAKAEDQVIFKLWEGLGYYTRCRNLIAAARYISKELNGKFPSTYEEINALKGVGPYTASAISSFAFNLPYAVVDGNVFRILARVFGVYKPIDATEGKKYFAQLANDLLDKTQAGTYNQAIMDFGAVVCKPSAPLCNECVFNKTCFAFLKKKVSELPVKGKKISIKKRWFYYLVMQQENEMAVRQRTGKDIWNQLYEFPMLEKDRETSIEAILREAEKSGWLSKKKYEVVTISPLFKQKLSHQLIAGQFIKIKLQKKGMPKLDMFWIKTSQLKKYAFPRFITQYFDSSAKQTLF
jgi:A/G-specific adenine glycosylase